MARGQEWFHNQVKAGMGLPASTTAADLASGNGSTPNPLTTDDQIDRLLDAGRFLICRHLRLVPGRAKKTLTVGQVFYDLSSFDAIQAASGSDIPTGGDGSRLWALHTARIGANALTYCRRDALRTYNPGYETESNNVVRYYYSTDEAGERIGLYPIPNLALDLLASGYVIPPSIKSGATSFGFLADDEYEPLLSYVKFKIGEQVGPGIDEAIAAKMGLWASDWNNAAQAWFARLSDSDKRDYRMVLPLIGSVAAAGGGMGGSS